MSALSLVAQAPVPALDLSHRDPWRGFAGTTWRGSVDTRSFIQDNYRPYEGDAAFLAGPTERTNRLHPASPSSA